MVLAQPSPPPSTRPDNSTYNQILKSSALVGGSSVLTIAIGIIRTKALAVLLGPTGVGLFGLYNSIIDFAQSIAGIGVNSSGVRQIAEAAGSNDTGRIGLTTVVLRRTSLLLGALGAVSLVALSSKISSVTFGDTLHSTAVALLSIAVFFRLVSAGQGALIQGMRRISDLAKMSVAGALSGTVISIAMVYWFRESGIVPSLIAVAAMTIVTSWWYSRKIKIETPSIQAGQIRQEAASLLALGTAFMVSSVASMGSAYVIRIILLRNVGFEATGLYQSAWTLGGLYVGVILQAMGSDFYPRLTAVSANNAECNRLVNEQAAVSLLLAGPGVLATLTFAPLVIALFYSPNFYAAVGLLRWICLGMTLRVVSWPMGFVVVAKGERKILLWTEFAATAVHIGLAYVFIRWFGLAGSGIAFFGLYVWHGLLTYMIVRSLSGFRWSAANIRTGLVFLPLTGLVFCAFALLPFWIAMIVGITSVALGSVYSVKALLRLVSLRSVPEPISGLLSRLGLMDRRLTDPICNE